MVVLWFSARITALFLVISMSTHVAAARVRAAREEGVTARGGGGSRARLAAGRASALREVGVLGAAAAARDGAGRVTPRSQVLLEKSGLRVRSRRVKRDPFFN